MVDDLFTARFSRRTALQAGGIAGAAALLRNGEGQAAEPAKYEGFLKDFETTDQYGKKFDPQILAGRPHIVVFGYGGCPVCANIGKNLGAIQSALLQAGKDVPIVVISITPEDDGKMDNRKEYVARYRIAGVRQFPGEKLASDEESAHSLGEKSYDENKDANPKDRQLHVLVAKDRDTALAMHEAAGFPVNKNPRVKKHTPYITPYDGTGQKLLKANEKVFGDIPPTDDFARRQAVNTIMKAVERAEEKTR